MCGGRQSTAGVESDLLAPRCALCDDATLNRFCLHLLTSEPDVLGCNVGFSQVSGFSISDRQRANYGTRGCDPRSFGTALPDNQAIQTAGLHHDHFIERHIGEALQAIFFNSAAFRGRPECYVPSEDVRKLFPFIPILEALAIDGAFLAPRSRRQPFSMQWSFPNFRALALRSQRRG